MIKGGGVIETIDVGENCVNCFVFRCRSTATAGPGGGGVNEGVLRNFIVATHAAAAVYECPINSKALLAYCALSLIKF